MLHTEKKKIIHLFTLENWRKCCEHNFQELCTKNKTISRKKFNLRERLFW